MVYPGVYHMLMEPNHLVGYGSIFLSDTVIISNINTRYDTTLSSYS